jgi:hypothetical protein
MSQNQEENLGCGIRNNTFTGGGDAGVIILEQDKAVGYSLPVVVIEREKIISLAVKKNPIKRIINKIIDWARH